MIASRLTVVLMKLASPMNSILMFDCSYLIELSSRKAEFLIALHFLREKQSIF
jgi:hypothetical protein